MHFYEPGAYEDFIGKLASIRLKPSPKVWIAISSHLQCKESARKRILLQRLVAAASFILLFGISYFTFLIFNININNEIPLWGHHDNSSNIIPLYSVLTTQDDFNLKRTSNEAIKPFTGDMYGSSVNLNIFSLDNNDNDHLLTTIKPIVSTIPIVKEEIFQGRTLHAYLQTDYTTNNLTLDHVYHNGNITTTDDYTKKWELIAYINPTYAYHTTAALNQKLNPNEIGAWMWGGDIMIKRRISRYFSISSGLQLSPIGQVNKNVVLLRSDSYNKDMMVLSANTSYGVVSLENRVVAISNFSTLACAPPSVIKSSTVTPARLSQHFYFLEIPIIVSTSLKKKYFEAEFKLGCSSGILISNQFEVISTEGKFYGKTENVRLYNTNAIGSVCFNIPFKNELVLAIEPSMKLSLNPISYSYISTYPFSTALKIGIGYKF
jgi:hypothetical protein